MFIKIQRIQTISIPSHLTLLRRQNSESLDIIFLRNLKNERFFFVKYMKRVNVIPFQHFFHIIQYYSPENTKGYNVQKRI